MPCLRRPPNKAPVVPAPCRAVNFLLVTLVGALASATAFASTAVFQLQDKTNLKAGTYQIYVTGFSTGGPYVLQSDGSWGPPAAPNPPSTTTTLSCWRFPQDIT